MKDPRKSLRLQWAQFVIVTVLAVAGGLFVSKVDVSVLKAEAEERYTELQTFSKVLNLVQQYYVEEVDTKKLIYGAIKGMLRELDPHTNFLPPEAFKDFETETSGEFGGLGIEISVTNGILTIISPIEDTPAWEAGVKAGDKVVAVDGHSTKGLSLVEASQLIRGKKGTKTVLTIVRDGEEEPIDIGIVRGNVKIKSVKYTDLDEGYAYIKITSFIENTGRDLEKTLSEHQKKYTNVKGVIIDLRRNPGGLLEQAVKVSDMFLHDGVIVSTIGRDPKNKEVLSASKKGSYTDFPLILLMNEYSASASEIVAGALQDNKRAIVMGSKSFGKGSVQSVIKLGDGSGLKLTVARYYTPSGKSIQAEGITPDIDLEDVDVDAFGKAIVKPRGAREKDIQGHLLSETEMSEKGKQEKDESHPAAPETKPVKSAKGEKTPKKKEINAWWKEVATKKDAAQTPKDKLIAGDYQIFQAYNYLKAWKLMQERK